MIVVILGVVVVAMAFVIYARSLRYDDNDMYLLAGIIFLTGIAIAILGTIFGIDIPTQQEKCENAGFTWQSTNDLIETDEGYEYRYICVDL